MLKTNTGWLRYTKFFKECSTWQFNYLAQQKNNALSKYGIKKITEQN